MIKEENLISILKNILEEASYEEKHPLGFLKQIDDDKYKLLCSEGLEVDTSLPIDERKYKGEFSTGFRSSDGTFQDISEKTYGTNIPYIIQVVERSIVETEEHGGYAYPENKFERFLLIKPDGDDKFESMKFLKHLTEKRLENLTEKLFPPVAVESVKVSFYEKKADGYADTTWTADISQHNLKPYDPDDLQLTKADKRIGELDEVGKEIPTVFFTVKCCSPGFTDESVNLYWIEKLGYWVGISEHMEMEHDHANPWSDFHAGPFKVEGFFAEKLLEAYGVDKQNVAGRDISKIAPHGLEMLATKQKEHNGR